jgi:hypothetical protein
MARFERVEEALRRIAVIMVTVENWNWKLEFGKTLNSNEICGFRVLWENENGSLKKIFWELWSCVCESSVGYRVPLNVVLSLATSNHMNFRVKILSIFHYFHFFHYESFGNINAIMWYLMGPII